MPAPNSPTSFVFDSTQNNTSRASATANLSSFASPEVVQTVLLNHARREMMYTPYGAPDSAMQLRFVVGASLVSCLDEMYRFRNSVSSAMEAAEEEMSDRGLDKVVVYALVPIHAVTSEDLEDDDTDF